MDFLTVGDDTRDIGRRLSWGGARKGPELLREVGAEGYNRTQG